MPGIAGLTSPQVVEVFGIAHESEVPQQLQLEKEMDLENNQVGINYCYTGCDNQTDGQIAIAIKGMVDVGYMTYLTPTLTELQDVNFWGLNWGITGIEDPETATHGLILVCPPPYNCALTTKKPTNQ